MTISVRIGTMHAGTFAVRVTNNNFLFPTKCFLLR